MGSFNFKCACCKMPINEGMECLSVYIKNGFRQMDTLRVGILKDCGDMSISQSTSKYSSIEQFNGVIKLMADEQGKFDIHTYDWMYFDSEKEAQCGYAFWHIHCLEKEIGVQNIIDRRIKEKVMEFNSKLMLMYEKKASKEAIEVAIEIHKENLEEISSLNGDFFNNKLLRQKSEDYSIWNQNPISDRGQFGEDEACIELYNSMEAFAQYLELLNYNSETPFPQDDWDEIYKYSSFSNGKTTKNWLDLLNRVKFPSSVLKLAYEESLKREIDYKNKK